MSAGRLRSRSGHAHGFAWIAILMLVCDLAAVRIARAADESGASDQEAGEQRQSRQDAWWTGPLLAASAGTLPAGHMLIEPYVFDSMPQAYYDQQGNRQPVGHANDFGSLSYLLYGITDRISAGLIPRFAFDRPATGPDSAHIEVGDLGLQAQYGLTRFTEGSWIPSTSLVIGETLPTGNYDKLGNRTTDGVGQGVYATVFGLYSQSFLWMPNGRILRARLDLSYSIEGSANVRDVSVYGTSQGFRGEARVGNTALIDAAGEYSLTRNWVIATDLVYEHDGNTRVAGAGQTQNGVFIPGQLVLNSGSSHSLSVAPALEYNFNARIGIIAGAKVTVAGRNATAVVIPVAAVNMFL